MILKGQLIPKKMAEAEQNPQPFENPMFREIHKNTWLKKISPSNSKKVFSLYNNISINKGTYFAVFFLETRKIMGCFLCS